MMKLASSNNIRIKHYYENSCLTEDAFSENISLDNRKPKTNCNMKRLSFVLSQAAFSMFAVVCSVSAQELPPDQAQRLKEIEEMEQKFGFGNLQNDPRIRQMNDERRQPIETAPTTGGRVNGYILDENGNPIQYRDVKACERDIVGRAVMEWSAGGDGFFDLLKISDINNKISFEADGYETQTLPFDRGTYQIRLKPAACKLKPGDVISGRVSVGNWGNPGGVLVEEIDSDGKVVASTKTENGQFKLTIVKPGNTLKVSLNGYTTFTAPIEISNYVLGQQKIQ